MTLPPFGNRMISAAFVFSMLLLLPAAAAGEEPLTLTTHPTGAILEMSGGMTIRGRTPIPLFVGQEGTYKIRVDLGGYERVYGSLSLSRRETAFSGSPAAVRGVPGGNGSSALS